MLRLRFALAGRAKRLVASTVAAYAITVVTFPANAPGVHYKNPAYSPSHLLVPTTVMGIRADTWLLKLPFVG